MLPVKREPFDISKEEPSNIGCAGLVLLFVLFAVSVLLDKCSSVEDAEVEPTSEISLELANSVGQKKIA